MGEISDALRRAREEQEARDIARAKEEAPPAPEPAGLPVVHTEAAVEEEPEEVVPELPKDSFPLSLDMVRADVESRDEPEAAAPPQPAVPEPAPSASPAPAPAASPAPQVEVAAESASVSEPGSVFANPSPSHVTISRERTGKWHARSVLIPDSQTAEQYRHFAVRLGREISRKQLRSIAIVSALREEGKTTTSCNLAFATASVAGGRRTALVDLDLRRPSLAKALEVHPEKGIDTVLAGHATLEEARMTTDLPALDVYPVAHAMSRAHERIAAPTLARVIRELEAEYDLVIFDSPPVLLVPDVALLAPHIGGYVVVLRSRRTMRQAFTKLLEILPNEKMLGTFLNDVRVQRLSKYHTTYYRSDEYAETTAE